MKYPVYKPGQVLYLKQMPEPFWDYYPEHAKIVIKARYKKKNFSDGERHQARIMHDLYSEHYDPEDYYYSCEYYEDKDSPEMFTIRYLINYITKEDVDYFRELMGETKEFYETHKQYLDVVDSYIGIQLYAPKIISHDPIHHTLPII